MRLFSSKKTSINLFRISFLPHVKDHLYDKFCYVVKVMPCFFSNKQKLNLVVKNPRTCVRAYKKYAGTHVLGFVITKFSFCLFEEKKICVLLFQDSKGKPNFLESALFHREIVGLTNIRPDIAVCIVNVMISIKRYSSKFFRISFDELLKVITVLITNIL